MKTLLEAPPSSAPAFKKNLDQLVSLLAEGALPTAVRRNCFIVNDIPEALPVSIDDEKLATVLGGMLHSVVNRAENSCIRVTARQVGYIVLVQVKDNSIVNSEALSLEMQQVQSLVNDMGGYLSIEGKRKKFTGIGFSFLNYPATA